MDRDIATTSVQCLQSTYAQHQLHQGGAIGVCFLIGAGKFLFQHQHSITRINYYIILGPFVVDATLLRTSLQL